MSDIEDSDSISDRNDERLDDEGFSESDAWSTISLLSEAEDYLLLKGRQYPNESIGYCWEPNDQRRREKWENCQGVYLSLVGSLYKAEVPQGCKRVLDIGTGTGTWALEFADRNSHIEVTGTDIAPIQPRWVPPNLEFQIENCDEEWTFSRATFDFIRAWGLNGSVDRNKFTKETFKNLAPGGVVEFGETCIALYSKNGPLAETCTIKKWQGFFEEVRKPFMVTDDGTLHQAVKDAGFEDIKEYKYEIPVGPWKETPEERELGVYGLEEFCNDIEGTMLRLAVEELSWSYEDTCNFASQLRKDVRLHCKAHKLYILLIVVVGKKPELG